MARFEVPLVEVNQVPDDGSTTIDFFGRKAHVVRGKDGQPAAFMDICGHLGGPVDCIDGEFVCQWHQGRYDARTGVGLTGPFQAGSRLMRLPTVVKDGVLTYVWDRDDAA